MSRPRDTRKDALAAIFPPLAHQVAPGGIEEQEAEGAAAMQATDCEIIPTEINGGTEQDLTAIGFVLGPVVKADPLFREATLPAGWKRVGTGHAMWTHLVDEHGRERVAMFYKAAYYDRSAFLRVNTLRAYVDSLASGKGVLVLDDTWATPEATLAAIKEARKRAVNDVEFWVERDSDSKYADEYRAEVARFDELAAMVERKGQK